MSAVLQISAAQKLARQQRAAADYSLRRTSGGLVVPRDAVPFLALPQAPIPSPGYGVANQVILAQYQVPTGWLAYFAGVLMSFDGTGFHPGSGDIVWSVDVNRDLGAPLTLGYAEKDFGSILVPLGSYAAGPWPVDWRHTDGETIRLKVYTVANVGVGVPNFMTGGLFGFAWPGDSV
jgi:hypothetical protein